MSSEVAHVVRSPLGKPATSLEKTVTPGSKGNSPSTRITREPRGASTSGTSPTLKSAGVSQRRSPGGPRPSYSGKGEKERSLCSPSSSRPKCGDSKCRCATRHSSPGGKYQSKPLVKAVPCSNGKNTRMVCDPKEIQELESAEKKKLSTPRSASTSRSPSPNVQKKSKAGNGGTKAKKTAVKVPEMDADNKTLSQLNANINNLFLEQLRMLLSSLKLDDRYLVVSLAAAAIVVVVVVVVAAVVVVVVVVVILYCHDGPWPIRHVVVVVVVVVGVVVVV